RRLLIVLLLAVAGRSVTATAQGASESPAERSRRLQKALLARHRLEFTERDVQLSSPRLRVHIIEVGRGEPLLLIHGGNGVGAQWLPLIARLSARRLIVPDRPGCGLSDGFLYDGIDMRDHGAR